VGGKKSDLGPIGIGVSRNVRALREDQNLSYAELSRRVTAAGRDIAALGLRRIEYGTRRVDADDLVALALALGVSPVTLLMPPASDRTEQVAATETAGKLPAERLWNWLCADAVYSDGPFDAGAVVDFQLSGAFPLWRKRLLLDLIESLDASRSAAITEGEAK
jgi:transcriptional regulator with XRE-family HTH domain